MFINKYELYKQLSTRIVKDTNMNEIENYSYVRKFMKVTPVLNVKMKNVAPEVSLKTFMVECT